LRVEQVNFIIIGSIKKRRAFRVAWFESPVDQGNFALVRQIKNGWFWLCIIDSDICRGFQQKPQFCERGFTAARKNDGSIMDRDKDWKLFHDRSVIQDFLM
jgi:hypothetical protein